MKLWKDKQAIISIIFIVSSFRNHNSNFFNGYNSKINVLPQPVAPPLLSNLKICVDQKILMKQTEILLKPTGKHQEIFQ